MGRLDSKVVIITGAAGGIGQATARLFIAEGARVMLTDVAAEAGFAIAASLGKNAAFIAHDVCDDGDWSRAVNATQSLFGPVNVLFNNAGITLPPTSIEDMAEAQFRRAIDVNLVSVFLGTRALVPSMQVAGGGSIINTSSVAGLVGLGSAAGYVASKFAVSGLTKASAIDLGRLGIRVNTVHPGLIDTPMVASMSDDARVRTVAFAQSLPAGRMGMPEDVAQVALFLASDASGFCTGAAFVADGGWTTM